MGPSPGGDFSPTGPVRPPGSGNRADTRPEERLEPFRLVGPDEPHDGDLPRFVDDLAAAVGRALEASPEPAAPDALSAFTWDAVFARVERVWLAAGDPGDR